MAEMGFRTMEEMIGRTDKLCVKDEDLKRMRELGLDLSPILTIPKTSNVAHSVGKWGKVSYSHTDNCVVDLPLTDLLHSTKRQIELDINNTCRSVGATLSYHISKQFGPDGLPKEKNLLCTLKGTAGQSFGAFLTGGVTLWLKGDGNDYVGKGLCGGRIIIDPEENTVEAAASGVVVGNGCLYGATSGDLFVRGKAAQRFAVRNSGANAVIEGETLKNAFPLPS